MKQVSRREVIYGFGLGVFLVLLTYDGAMRKWGFPLPEQIVFILKDVLLLLMTAMAVLSRGGARIYAPVLVRQLIALYGLVVLLEVFNPLSPGVLVGLWGLKAHVLYAGLIFVLPMAYANLADLFRSLEKIYPWVAIPVCLIAFAQSVSGADSFLNQQVRGGIEGIAYFGEQNLVRVAGTFSYISGMGAFVQFMSLLGIGLFIGGARKILFLIGLGFVLSAIPVTGSRAVLLLPIVGAILIITGAYWSKLIAGRQFIGLVTVVGALLAFSLVLQDDAWNALQQRIEDNREEGEGRMITAFTNAFEHMEVAGLFGYGAGTANMGAVALTDEVPFSWFPPIWFEEESGRIVLELGIWGWFVSMLMRIALLNLSLRLARPGKAPEVRLVGVMALPFMAFGIYSGSGVFAASYMAVGYWFMVAMMVIARREQTVLLRSRQIDGLAVGRRMVNEAPGRGLI